MAKVTGSTKKSFLSRHWGKITTGVVATAAVVGGVVYVKNGGSIPFMDKVLDKSGEAAEAASELLRK